MSVASVFTQNAVRFRDSLKNEVQRWETHRAAHPLEAPLDVDEKVLAFLERIEEVFDRRIRVSLPCHAVLAAVLIACLRRCSATSSRSRPRRRTRPPCRCSMRSSTPCNRAAAGLDACCLRGLLLRRPFPLPLACHCLLRLDARALLLFTCPVTLRNVSVLLQAVGRRGRRKRGKDAARDQLQLESPWEPQPQPRARLCASAPAPAVLQLAARRRLPQRPPPPPLSSSHTPSSPVSMPHELRAASLHPPRDALRCASSARPLHVRLGALPRSQRRSVHPARHSRTWPQRRLLPQR
jgi:hypothetical protein